MREKKNPETEKKGRSSSKPIPALTQEARENQLVNLAMEAVEKRIKEGKATSQEICYFLKLGSSKEKLEKENMLEQNKLLKAKTEMIQSQKRMEEQYVKALEAMRKYSGSQTSDDEEEDLYG